MILPTHVPHFLLFSESHSDTEAANLGAWRIVLESVDGRSRFEAHDDRETVTGERLELLAVVRGLEALDQPSRVTIVTHSRYVSRGLRYGLHQWRESAWQWEHFGKMEPVANSDLWQRIDDAMRINSVACRCWRFDAARDTARRRKRSRVRREESATAATPSPPPVSTNRLRDRQSRTNDRNRARTVGSRGRGLLNAVQAAVTGLTHRQPTLSAG